VAGRYAAGEPAWHAGRVVTGLAGVVLGGSPIRLGDVAGEYRMARLPTSILIDRSGAMAAVAAGARDWDSAGAHQVIERLLIHAAPFLC
jgi:hypothetical protein